MFDDDLMDLKCVKGYDTDECIKKIDHEKAHIMSLDAGEVFVAGRYFSLIPIMQETLEGGLSNYYAVAVVKKGSLPDVHHIRNLRNKKACFAYVGSQAGWNIPIYTVSYNCYDSSIGIFNNYLNDLFTANEGRKYGSC